MADRQDNRSSDEIRRDIEGTRSELHETVDALERKLSVGQLVDEVWGRVGGGGTAGSAASRVGEAIRDHPVPLALMGLGVAWLAVDKATGSTPEVGAGTYRRADGRVGPYRGDAIEEGSSALDTATDKAGSVADTVKEKASDAASTVKARAAGAADAAKAKASHAADTARAKAGDAKSSVASGDGRDMGDRASDAADRVRREAETRGRQAKRGFWSAMEEQPLALGAVAFGLGLASGLSAPTTRVEDRAMGEAADAVKGEAKRAATDAAGSARDVAADTARAAKEEADRQDVAGDLKQAGKRIASEAKETAKQRAEEEDLHPEGMKSRASDAVDRTQDRAT